MLCVICDHLYNLKSVKNTHGGALPLVAHLLRVALLYGGFSRFFLEEFVLNCAKQMLLKNIHIHSSNLLIFNFLNCFLFWNSTRDCQVNDSTVNFISSGKLSGISQKPRCHLCICWKLCIPIIMKPIDSGHCLAVIEKSTFNNLNMYEFKCFLKRVRYVK